MPRWKLGGLEHSQLKDRVYHYLREAIIAGEFSVGAALRENDITGRLGVSKTPVREAFVRLEKDRLLVLVPYKGAVVAGYTNEDLREFYEVRELVQGACARMAAPQATDELRSELQENVAASSRAFDQRKFTVVVRLFEEFDEIIYRQSTNRWIDELVENLEGHQRRIGRLDGRDPRPAGPVGQAAPRHLGRDREVRRRCGRAADARARPQRADRPAPGHEGRGWSVSTLVWSAGERRSFVVPVLQVVRHVPEPLLHPHRGVEDVPQALLVGGTELAARSSSSRRSRVTSAS